MAQVRIEREKAAACALAAARTALPSGQDFFTGAASIDFEVRLRKFRDALANLPASLKAMQDGLCRGLVDRPGTFAVLPDGDGPETRYDWRRPTQVKVKTKAEEGVLVTIRSTA